MKLPIYIVDTFTKTQFKGNSAAVVPLSSWLDDKTMLSIAQENNLSETAFYVQEKDNSYTIRWFSPITEIDFCGHATLATAYILFNELKHSASIIFNTLKVGKLIMESSSDGRVLMSFPNQKPERVNNTPEYLQQGLSIPPYELYKNRQAYVVVYKSESDVKEVTYNSSLLKKLAPYDVVVTSEGSSYDFVSRYFWPANGGDEDPVTGSIHTCLAPLWAEKLNRDILTAQQLSNRTGILYCRVTDERVYIEGDAKLYLKGEIYI